MKSCIIFRGNSTTLKKDRLIRIRNVPLLKFSNLEWMKSTFFFFLPTWSQFKKTEWKIFKKRMLKTTKSLSISISPWCFRFCAILGKSELQYSSILHEIDVNFTVMFSFLWIFWKSEHSSAAVAFFHETQGTPVFYYPLSSRPRILCIWAFLGLFGPFWTHATPYKARYFE